MVTVTGYGGQLSSELYQLKKGDPNWSFLSIDNLDITKINDVANYFLKKPCNIIVNCAAYTAVDEAEQNINAAFNVNQIGVKNLLKVCNKMGAKLVHFSTDYVFGGNTVSKYNELCPTSPIGVYGKSKVAGELEILKSNVQSIIIRTSWLYSNFGENFVKNMLQLASYKKEIDVVFDQIGSPTNAKELAFTTLKILDDEKYKWSVGDIFHYSNQGKCSWHEFSEAIFKIAEINIKVNKLSTAEFPTRDLRPKYSLLDKKKIKKTFSIEINHWKDSLREMLKKELELL